MLHFITALCQKAQALFETNLMQKLIYFLFVFFLSSPAWALDFAETEAFEMEIAAEQSAPTGEETDPEEVLLEEYIAMLEKASAGDAEAQTAIGVYYLQGETVGRDYELAMQWFNKAAKQNDSSAQFYIGLMYSEGMGLKRDYVVALEWYEKSAAQNDAKGFYGIGLLYFRGKGIKRDYKTAQGFFQHAASLGNPDAYAYLGIIYEKGLDVEKQLDTAFQYNTLGAEGGSLLAQYNLSRMYYKGRGVEKDMIMAYKWIAISRFMGNDSDQAMEHMNMVSKWLSSKDFDIAKDLTRQWLKNHNVVRRAPLMKISWF